MIFPEWALFGLCAAVFSAAMMLLQERFKANNYALAFWNKAACIIVALPLTLYHGFPQDPMFYTFVAMTAVIFAINDVIFFRVIAEIGAGTISRILPSSVIFSFLLWLVVSPGDLRAYLSTPVISAMIFAVLCLWVYFATRLKSCPVSVNALKSAWYLVVALIFGFVLGKKALAYAPIEQGPYAYIFVQATMMMTLWTIFFAFKKPVTTAILFSRRSLRAGAIIGCVSSMMIFMGLMALYRVDNPAYSQAVSFLDSVIILGIYALTRRRNDSNVAAGIGMVACAAALVILKAQV